MLVAIDIGNTNITIGIFDQDTLIGNYRLTTKVRRTSDEYGFMLKTFLSQIASIKNCNKPILYFWYFGLKMRGKFLQR